MSSLTLQQLFGTNAYQNVNALVITKLDFSNLVSSVSNSAESLLVAILVHAYAQFSGVVVDEQNNTVVDEQNKPIEFDNSNLYELIIDLWKIQLADSKIQHTFVIHQLEEVYASI